jgi:hypothetical protein
MSPVTFEAAIKNQIALTQKARQHLLANAPGLQGETAPKVGERKKFPNGTTGEWDGTGWVAVK